MIDSTSYPKEAMFYKKDKGTTVQCLLCPRECVIAMGKEAFVETEKTKGEHYTLWSMVDLLLLTLGPLKRRPSIISSLVIFDYVLPVRVAI